MKTPIFKTEENAIINAKMIAIRFLESAEGINVNDDLFIKSDVWLIQSNKSCQCQCGETGAVHVVLFADKINDNILSEGDAISIEGETEQYYGMAGICNGCGQ